MAKKSDEKEFTSSGDMCFEYSEPVGSKWKEECKVSRTDNRILRLDNDELRASRNRLSAENERLEEELDKEKNNIKMLKGWIEELTREKDELKKGQSSNKNENVIAELEYVKQQFETEKKSKHEIWAEKIKITQELTETKEELENLKEDHQRLTQKLSDLERQSEELAPKKQIESESQEKRKTKRFPLAAQLTEEEDIVNVRNELTVILGTEKLKRENSQIQSEMYKLKTQFDENTKILTKQESELKVLQKSEQEISQNNSLIPIVEETPPEPTRKPPLINQHTINEETYYYKHEQILTYRPEYQHHQMTQHQPQCDIQLPTPNRYNCPPYPQVTDPRGYPPSQIRQELGQSGDSYVQQTPDNGYGYSQSPYVPVLNHSDPNLIESLQSSFIECPQPVTQQNTRQRYGAVKGQTFPEENEANFQDSRNPESRHTNLLHSLSLPGLSDIGFEDDKDDRQEKPRRDHSKSTHLRETNRVELSTSTKVTIVWKKEIPTLERDISYFDSINGTVSLKWSDVREDFQGDATLSIGQHTGTIVFPTDGEINSVKHFEVRKGGKERTLILLNVVSGKSPENSETLGYPT